MLESKKSNQDFYDFFPSLQKFSIKEKIQKNKIHQFLFDWMDSKGNKCYYNMRFFFVFHLNIFVFYLKI